MSEKSEQYITKEPDGSYSVRVSGRVGKKIFTRRKRGLWTLGEARGVRMKFMSELAQRKERFANGMLWTDALEDYLKMEPNIQKPKTFLDVSTALRAHTTAWSEKTIQEINDRDVYEMVQDSLEDAEDATRNKVIGYISRVFKYYIVRGRAKYNPTAGIRYGSRKRDPDKKLTAMTREEMMTLLARAKEIEHPWFNIWFIDYQTGMRSMELYALEWRQIDFEHRRITIDQSFDGKTTDAPTKNGKIRVVSMANGLSQLLRELKLRRGGDQFVLPRNKEWEHGKAAEVLRSFQRDIGLRETNFHSIRASYITHLLLKGVPVTKVQELVGHLDLKTTMKYVRLLGTEIIGASDVIDVDLDELSGACNVIPFKKPD